MGDRGLVNSSAGNVGVNDDVVADVPLDLPLVIADVFVAVLATSGNAYVIHIFRMFHAKKSVTNYMYYVLSLAVADLLVGTLAVPCAVITNARLPIQFEACVFTISLLLLPLNGSIFSLVALSTDRYLAIIHPLYYKTKMTSRRTMVMLAVSWALAVITALLPLGWNRGPPPMPRCSFVEILDPDFLLFYSVVSIFVPSAIMIGVYAKIVWVIRMRNPRTGHTAHGRKEFRITLNLFILIVLFVISWTPINIINTVRYFCRDCQVPVALLQVAIILSHANSIWNVALYAWGLKDFRAELMKQFPCRQCLATDTVDTETTSM